MPDPWDPPLDMSGGYFIMEYSNTTYTHRQRVHIDQFNTLTLNYNTAHGTEINVSDTMTNWLQQMKVFWDSGWTLSILSLFQWQTGVLVQLIPPTITPVAGTNGGTPAFPPTEQIYNCRTVNGHRARFVMIMPTGVGLQAPIFVTHTSASPDGPLMTYLATSANSAVVAHDGSRIIDYAKKTVGYNRRLRRRYRLD